MTKRSYTETEKIGTMLLALRDGVVKAGEQTETPTLTIYQWFRDADPGGIEAIRRFTDAATDNALLDAKRALFVEVARRCDAGEMDQAQLMVTFRSMIEEETKQAVAPLAAAQAGAQATLQVVIQGTGETIEVPRE
jgi:hypothetical protein